MNMKALLGLVVLIIIGVGAYMVLGKHSNTDTAVVTDTNTDQSGSSLGQLVAAGQPVSCTFSTSTAAGITNGTMYISGGMVRGDFTTTGTQVGSLEAHMVVRDNTSYMWTSASNQGFKSTVSSDSSSSAQGGVDYNAQMNYTCQPWTPDTTKFNLPQNISFVATQTYTAPNPNQGAAGAPTGVKGTAAQCAQCNTLSGASKAQCLVALSCP